MAIGHQFETVTAFNRQNTPGFPMPTEKHLSHVSRRITSAPMTAPQSDPLHIAPRARNTFLPPNHA